MVRSAGAGTTTTTSASSARSSAIRLARLPADLLRRRDRRQLRRHRPVPGRRGRRLPVHETKWGYDANGIVQYFAGPTPDVTLEFHLSFVSPLSTVWRLVRNDGQVTTFDRAGFLSSITDPAGNSLTFGWAARDAAGAAVGRGLPRPSATAPRSARAGSYGLTKAPIGQRRRLLFATDAARTVYYEYSQTDTEQIHSERPPGLYLALEQLHTSRCWHRSNMTAPGAV